MHINWATQVSLPRYPGSQLPADIRREISNATDDDLLAAYLHWTEGRIALDFAIEAESLAGEIKSERDQLDVLTPPADTRYTAHYHRSHAALHAALSKAARTAEGAHKEAQTIWDQLREQTSHDLTAKYNRGDGSSPNVMERIGVLHAQASNAEQAVQAALTAHREKMHRLALAEDALERFLDSPDSIGLEDIHAMTPSAFEQTVADLARRDGHRVIRDRGGARDLGADVIAVTADGLRIVFQCKHRKAGLGKVGSPEMQTFNGTARPEHNADIVVAVTNGDFTKPASEFAYSHDIDLVGQQRLKRWATWGEPLLTLLEATRKPPRAAAA
ncbi:restriction endonuclease [Streptomyces longhuiensis]|uniref:restriction endonuclease n=1 Tax=Streptomyces longhuiensis TaxID=2880933 RepID=UPI001D0B8335|nr:restriction endonuclease [Streptomyces longhuiensis]UDM05585.1 restriction endonuclease [Streptomyces longhuiensis]